MLVRIHVVLPDDRNSAYPPNWNKWQPFSHWIIRYPHEWNLIHALKFDVWKMTFPSNNSSFWGDEFAHFLGGKSHELQQLQSCPSLPVSFVGQLPKKNATIEVHHHIFHATWNFEPFNWSVRTTPNLVANFLGKWSSRLLIWSSQPCVNFGWNPPQQLLDSPTWRMIPGSNYFLVSSSQLPFIRPKKTPFGPTTPTIGDGHDHHSYQPLNRILGRTAADPVVSQQLPLHLIPNSKANHTFCLEPNETNPTRSCLREVVLWIF